MDLVAALLPSTALALLFWFVIRAVLRADRTEREQMARLDREERARAAREEPARADDDAPSAPEA